ncbi:MAG: FAD-dependent monooxygenase [Gammaproteobacteria bacterium]|nr:FAD-dependent monooxygenase [Gammaproteobacteria bacterium]
MARSEELTILISGGGPVGLTVAALLAASGAGQRCRIEVIESGPPPRWDPDEVDLRVYALSRASQRIFERLRLWAEIERARISPYERMHVWQGEEPDGRAALRFDSADVGEPDLGHIVEDRLLKHVLFERLESEPRVGLRTGRAVVAVERRARGVTVGLDTGETIDGALLVAADGADSAVRSLFQLPTVARSYAQQALVAHVTTELAHRRTAWQRFLPGGPLAFLPLADGRSSIVWSMPDTDAAALLAAPDGEFLAALQKASAGVLGRLQAVTPRARFPLQVMHALRYCCDRGVLVGDAAHAVHPLAGQGMNLGLADAACLAEEIDAALGRGEHPGDRRVLRRYERRRKAENLKMLLALDALHHLFRLPWPVAPLGGLGLAAVDAAPPARRALMRRALGLDGDVPQGPPPRAVA